MPEVRTTTLFDKWYDSLRDIGAQARVAARLDRLALGNPGDVRSVGSGVSELRIDHGPGYRVYYVKRGDALVIVLAGGTKGSQKKDIGRAIELAGEV